AVLEEVAAARTGTGTRTSSTDILGALDTSVLALLEDSLLYVWRRHLVAAIGRRLTMDRDTTEQAVGFADLSGFTKLSQRVSSERLAAVVDAVADIALDVVTALG